MTQNTEYSKKIVYLSIILIKYDENSLNEYAANALDIVKPFESSDKDSLPRRFYEKIKEFNQYVCTESEAVRTEKWLNWVKQEKQLFWGTNDVDNITIRNHHIFEQKVRTKLKIKYIPF